MTARKQTENALAQRARQGLLMGEVGAALIRSDNLQEMLQLCAQALVRHLDAALARIWMFNEAENILELKASAGLSTQVDGPRSLIPFGQLKIGLIAQERTPYFTSDLLNDSGFGDMEWARREAMAAFAGYPLVIEDRLLGVVGVYASRPCDSAVVDSIGAIAHAIALGVESSRSNEALREREGHLRLLLDSTAAAIYEIDVKGRCTFANPACARLLGYDRPDRLLGEDMHIIVQGAIAHASRRAEGSHSDTAVLRRADGSSFPAEYWSYPIRRDGEIVGSVVTFLDITKHRSLESRFQQSQQRLRQVVVSSPAVLFTLTIAPERVLGISWTSDNMCEILGYSPEATLGLDWWLTTIHPEDEARVTVQTKADLFTRGYSTEEYRFRHGNGEYCWVRCEIRLLRDDTGLPLEAVGAWLDITQWKLAEQEQSKLREQLQQAQKLESVGRLAGGVAHDFNNLLTVINGYGDLLLGKLKPGDPIHDSVTEIRKAGQSAVELTRQLTLLSRKQVTRARELNLNDLINEVEKMLGRVIGEDIRLETVLSPSLGSVLADAGQLHQVLMNLAVNARDAMPGGGTLRIETRNVDLEDNSALAYAERKPGPYVQLKVTDTGIGMTEDVMSHLFEPFFTTKKPGEGTGLGLATVYGIVKQTGGSISVSSEPGEGATFTVCLPRTDAAGKQPEPEPMPSSLSGRETILVVEDQNQLRDLVGRILRSYGYRVLDAANPGEALLHCERYAGPIHLMLTDVVMPGMTGLELARRLKPLRPEMEVVFMSGYSERAVTDHLELPGSYLAKPFSPQDLASKVRGVLGLPRSAGAILVVDEEPAIRKLLRNILTGISYQVLEAGNAAEAIQRAGDSAVDLMIADLAVLGQERIETIQALRRMRPELRIIAMSGQIAGPLASAAEFLGAQAVLAKPIQPDELLDAVACALVPREKLK